MKRNVTLRFLVHLGGIGILLAVVLAPGMEGKAAEPAVSGPPSTEGLAIRHLDWHGRICKRIHLSVFGMNTEKHWIEDNGNCALVVPYVEFDSTKPPVLIIHGFGPAFLIKDLAKRLQRGGRQVLIAFYDNETTAPHESGRQIAGALAQIRNAYYPVGMPLDIVAHSMGGIVGRCALNYLYEPTWMGMPAGVACNHAGGFGAMRLRTADTAIDGYGTTSGDDDINELIEDNQNGPLSEMYCDSEMFQRLYGVDLAGVDFRNHAAYRRNGKLDLVRSVAELDPQSAHALAAAIAAGTEPSDPWLRNLVRALRCDARYWSLCSGVLDAIARGRLSLSTSPSSGTVAALTAVYDSAMPRVRGKHIWLLNDYSYRDDDMVDVLARELVAP